MSSSSPATCDGGHESKEEAKEVTMVSQTNHVTFLFCLQTGPFASTSTASESGGVGETPLSVIIAVATCGTLLLLLNVVLLFCCVKRKQHCKLSTGSTGSGSVTTESKATSATSSEGKAKCNNFIVNNLVEAVASRISCGGGGILDRASSNRTRFLPILFTFTIIVHVSYVYLTFFSSRSSSTFSSLSCGNWIPFIGLFDQIWSRALNLSSALYR